MTLRVEDLEDVKDLGSFQLRNLDAKECFALGSRPEEAVDMCLDVSEEAYSVWIEDDLLAIWGWRWASFISSGLEFWLLTTPLVDKYPKVFVRECLHELKRLVSIYGSVSVRIWDGHTQAIRLAKRLGFKMAYISENELYAVKSDWSR